MERASTTRVAGRWGVWVGAALLAHFAFLCWLKIDRGIEEEVLWISHTSLALAAVGFLLGSRLCVSTALVCVLGMHSIWLFDAAWLGVTGRSPMGITAYLSDADALTWAGTAHHFYLIPLLLLVTIGERSFRAAALPTAIGVFAFLVGVCHTVVPADRNINGAHEFLPAVDAAPIAAINAAPAPVYVAMLVTGVTVVLFVPATALLVRIATNHPKRRATLSVATKAAISAQPTP